VRDRHLRLANPWARGPLRECATIVRESIIGTTFEERIVGAARVGPWKGVIAEITRRAWFAGITQLVLSPDDPFPRASSSATPGSAAAARGSLRRA